MRSAQSTPSKVEAKSGLRLVNYHDDTVISDDENENDSPERDDGSPMDVANADDADKEKFDESGENTETKAARKDRFAEYGFQLPSEPKGKCPADLQEKISNMYEKMKVNNMDMNKLIQERKEFRNPSIYEKLIQFCEIDELGTNYPPELYDPMQWTSMCAICYQHGMWEMNWFVLLSFLFSFREWVFLLRGAGQGAENRNG